MNSSPSVNVRQEKFSGDLLSELSTSLKFLNAPKMNTKMWN